MADANHSLNQRRDAREQEQIVNYAAQIAVEMTKPWVRFQSDIIGSYANSVLALAKVCGAQADNLMQYGQDQFNR